MRRRTTWILWTCVLLLVGAVGVGAAFLLRMPWGPTNRLFAVLLLLGGAAFLVGATATRARRRIHRSLAVPDHRADVGPDRAGQPTGPGVSSMRTPNRAWF